MLLKTTLEAVQFGLEARVTRVFAAVGVWLLLLSRLIYQSGFLLTTIESRLIPTPLHQLLVQSRTPHLLYLRILLFHHFFLAALTLFLSILVPFTLTSGLLRSGVVFFFLVVILFLTI